MLMNLFLCLLNDNSHVWYFKGVYDTIHYINGVRILQILKCLNLLNMCYIYHVYLNISNLLKVISMHKHCPNHFACLVSKWAKLFLLKNLVNFTLKLFLIQTFILKGLCEWITCANLILNCTLWLLTLTFAWLFHEIIFLHINISLCLLSVSLTFD